MMISERQIKDKKMRYTLKEFNRQFTFIKKGNQYHFKVVLGPFIIFKKISKVNRIDKVKEPIAIGCDARDAVKDFKSPE